MLTRPLWVVGVAAILQLVLFASRSSVAAQGERKRRDPPSALDLTAMTAHEESPDSLTPPAFTVKALLDQHASDTAACDSQLGGARGRAEVDGSGGCTCSFGFVMAEGRDGRKCEAEEDKQKSHRGLLGRIFGRKVQKGEHDDVEGMPACKGKQDCDDKLATHAESLAAQVQTCQAREKVVEAYIKRITDTLATDLIARESKRNETIAWISRMRSQNQLMISQLNKYNEQATDNARLSRDMKNMMRERRNLDSELSALEAKRDELIRERAQLDERSKSHETAQCEETVRRLSAGLKEKVYTHARTHARTQRERERERADTRLHVCACAHTRTHAHTRLPVHVQGLPVPQLETA